MALWATCGLCLMLPYLFFIDKGKASLLESEGVSILRMVLHESADEELTDLVFEILSSVIIDGEFSLRNLLTNFGGFQCYIHSRE